MASTFHIAFPIKDLNRTKEFYVNVLSCKIGRRDTTWMDIDFFGNQLTVQVNPDAVQQQPFYPSENSIFPPLHFGLVLPWKEWHDLQDILIKKKIEFIIKPQIVFDGEVGEQKTLFIQDPDGYFIEFKSFENEKSLFKSNIN